MTHYVEVTHHEWIAAEPAVVRAQFADLQHHIATGVHPKLRLELLQRDGPRVRYAQEVTLLGIRQRDVFVREFDPDGTMVDTSVEGFNRGGSLRFRFRPETHAGIAGTDVCIEISLPLPPLVGPLVRPLLASQIRREVAAAAAEDKHDIEVRGYRPFAAGTARAVLAVS